MIRFLPLSRRFFRDKSGMATVELMMVLPFLLLLVYASTEVARAIIIKQKVEQAGYTIASFMSTYQAATPSGNPGEIYWSTDVSKLNDPTNLYVGPKKILDETMSPYTPTGPSFGTPSSGVMITYLTFNPGGGGTSPRYPEWMVFEGSDPAASFTSIISNITVSDVGTAIACVEGASDDLSKRACWSTIRSTPLSFAPPYNGAIVQLYGTPGLGYALVEVYFDYGPLFQNLMTNVNAAAGTNIATFDFSLPDIRMKKTIFIFSRYDATWCVPGLLPCP